jgi:hypothetical protein
LTAEIISAISGLQTSLKISEIEIRIATKTPRDGDVLVLGTFADAEELASYINPFNISLDESGDTITLKNFGDIGRAGNGILLFEENKNGNRLTLLAETPEDLIALLSTVSSGSLYGCILQDNIGICSVGYGGSFFDETGGFGEDILTPEPATGDATPHQQVRRIYEQPNSTWFYQWLYSNTQWKWALACRDRYTGMVGVGRPNQIHRRPICPGRLSRLCARSLSRRTCTAWRRRYRHETRTKIWSQCLS